MFFCAALVLLFIIKLPFLSILMCLTPNILFLSLCRYSWLSSIERWLSVSSVSVLNTSQDPIIGPEVIIMSYDLLARRSKEFLKTHFGVVIMVSTAETYWTLIWSLLKTHFGVVIMVSTTEVYWSSFYLKFNLKFIEDPLWGGYHGEHSWSLLKFILFEV